MAQIKNYNIIREIKKGREHTVYLANKGKNTLPCVIKILNEDCKSSCYVEKLKLEYLLCKDLLNTENSPKMYSMEIYKHRPMIVMEYIEGQTLNKINKNTVLNIGEFLEIAVCIAEALSRIHDKSVIHKNLNLTNIIWNGRDKRIKIIDYEKAGFFSYEVGVCGAQKTEENYDYVHLDESEKIKKVINYRTDLYSLGIILYELLANRKPFKQEMYTKSLDFQISKIPKILHEINPEIPSVVSNIIIKLLEENEANGYSSTKSLLKDLRKCSELYRDSKSIETFNLDLAKYDSENVYVFKEEHNIEDKTYIQKKMKIGCELLKIYGINIFCKPANISLFLDKVRTTYSLKKIDIEDILNLPSMEEQKYKRALEILSNMMILIENINSKIFQQLVLKAINLSLKNGNTALSAYGYIYYSMMLAKEGKFDRAYRFGKLGCDIVDKYEGDISKAKIEMLFCKYNYIWKHHLKEAMSILMETHKIAFEAGDLKTSLEVVDLYAFAGFICGQDLSLFIEELGSIKNILRQEGVVIESVVEDLILQAINNIINNPQDPHILSGEYYDEFRGNDSTNYLHKAPMFLKYYCLLKIILGYFFCKYDVVLGNLELIGKELKSSAPTIFTVTYNFYESLTRLALCTKDRGKSKVPKEVLENQKNMKKWMNSAPVNYSHKYCLIEAEKYKVIGEHDKAQKYYHLAIKEAQRNGFVNEEGMANELAAKYYMSVDREEIGIAYLKQAIICYETWGADAKIRSLKLEYDKLYSSYNLLENAIDEQTNKNLHYNLIHEVDLYQVIDIIKTISKENAYGKLANTILKVLVDVTGATKCILFKKEEGNLKIDSIIDKTTKYHSNEHYNEFPKSVLEYVKKTKETLVLYNANEKGKFSNDTYIKGKNIRSILCIPLLNRIDLEYLLYLENKESQGIFTAEKIKVLDILSSHIVTCLDRAHEYRVMEGNIREKTNQLEIEEKKRLDFERLLEESASNDSLTQLPNRGLFKDRLEHALSIANRTGMLVAVIRIDLDFFKKVNMEYGFNSGDFVIQTIAKRLRKFLRQCDTVARYSGDEFVVILENMEEKHGIDVVCKRIQEMIIKPVLINDKIKCNITASLGVGIFPLDASEVDSIILKAENALQKAKENGRDCVVYFNNLLK